MTMDSTMCNKFEELLISHHLSEGQNLNIVATNLTQSAGIVGVNLMQQYGLPSAVPGLVAAGQVAAGAPKQANPG